MSPILSPGTLRTLLNSAPLIIQGAGKLIQIIRERDDRGAPMDADLPHTLDGLHEAMQRIDQRLDENDQSDIEQIRLIQELARQNELLTESLRRCLQRLQVVTVVSCLALAISLFSIYVAIAAQ